MSPGEGRDPGAPFLLAQANVARVLDPVHAEAARSFAATIASVTSGAPGAPGFVWQLPDEERGRDLPPLDGQERFVVNLSLWTSFDAMRAFVLRDAAHGDSMRRRGDWSDRIAFDGVLWWTRSSEPPTIDEALERVAHLREHGPSSHAFTMREPRPSPVD